MCITRLQSSKISKAQIAAALLIFAAVFRIPASLGFMRVSMLLLFEFAVTMMLCVLLWESNKFVSMFLGLAFFSLCYPQYERHAYLAFQSIFFGCLIFYFLVKILDSSNVVHILNAMVVITICYVIVQILQFFQLDVITTGFGCTGLVGNRNTASALIAFCTPAFFRKKFIYLIIYPIIGLILAKSSGGVIAVCAGTIFYCIIRGWKFWPVFIILLAGNAYLFLYDYSSESCLNRWEVWTAGIDFISKHWLFGYGLGHWKVIFSEIDFNGNWYSMAHNDLFQLFFETGIISVILIIFFLTEKAVKISERLKSGNTDSAIFATALIIIFVNSLVNFPWHVAPTAMIAIFWLAMLEVVVES